MDEREGFWTKLGFDYPSSESSKINSYISSLTKISDVVGNITKASVNLGSFAFFGAAGLAGAAVTAGLAVASLSKHNSDLANNIKNTARVIGLSSANLTRVMSVLDRLGVLPGETISSLQGIVKARIGAQTTNTEALKAFTTIGITPQELDDLNPIALALKASDDIKKRVKGKQLQYSIAESVGLSPNVYDALTLDRARYEKYNADYTKQTKQFNVGETIDALAANRELFIRVGQDLTAVGNKIVLELETTLKTPLTELATYLENNADQILSAVKVTADEINDLVNSVKELHQKLGTTGSHLTFEAAKGFATAYVLRPVITSLLVGAGVTADIPLIPLALLAGGGYLAYDYFKNKNSNNSSKLNSLTSSQSIDLFPNDLTSNLYTPSASTNSVVINNNNTYNVKNIDDISKIEHANNLPYLRMSQNAPAGVK